MNIVRTISTMIFPLITFPYTSRILGPDGTGKINFATSFVIYFVLLASIGIPMYGIREVARIRDDKKKLNATIQELFILHISTSIIVFVIFIGLIFANGKLRDEKSLFFIVSFSIIVAAFGMDWLYQGLEEYSYITIRSILFSTISTISIFLFINRKEDYHISAAISVCASAASSIMNFYNVRKFVIISRPITWDFKRHLKPLMKVYVMNFLISLYVNLDTVMLGFMSSTRNVGYYTSAMKLTKMLLGLVTSFSTVLLPRLSYYVANGYKEKFDNLLKKSLALILLISAPVVVALMMLSHEIIVLFAGNQYLPAANCIIIASPTILFIGLTNIFGVQILYPLGKDNMVTVSVGFGAVIAIFSNIILIPKLGHIGASISTLITEFSVLLIQFIIISKINTISWPFCSFTKIIIATASVIATIILVKWKIYLLWLKIIIVLPLSISIYLSILYMMRETLVIEILNNINIELIKIKKKYD